ncbi:UNVERIFIED_CONTAM: hypothetical protein ABIC26_002567 [Paenibacillus sp. PvR008]
MSILEALMYFGMSSILGTIVALLINLRKGEYS